MLKLHRSRSFPALAAAFGLALAAGSIANAAGLYRYTTEDGTVAYTDDPKHIPARYRAAAEARELPPMASYSRLTPTDDAAMARYEAGLTARLERLRALNQSLAAAAVEPAPEAPAPTRAGVTLRVGRDSEPTIDLPVGGDGFDSRPVVVERKRILDEDTSFTQHVTVVRQGDRVLSIVKPKNKQFEPPYWTTVQELEGR